MFNFKKPQYEYLIAGLGNPGPSYANTRHNAGFLVLQYLAEKESVSFRSRWESQYGEVTLGGARCLLQMPQTFMNKSGEAVGALCRFYKIPPERVIVIHDDITLAPGKIKIKTGGSCGGHNGLADIENHLGSQNYTHIKVGIGAKPHPEMPLADFVLGIIPPADRKLIDEKLPDIVAALTLLCAGETEKAKSQYNK